MCVCVCVSVCYQSEILIHSKVSQKDSQGFPRLLKVASSKEFQELICCSISLHAVLWACYLSLHAVTGACIPMTKACMQLQKLTFSYKSFYAITKAYIQIQKLACSYYSFHVVTKTSMQLQKLPCSSISLYSVTWAFISSISLNAGP